MRGQAKQTLLRILQHSFQTMYIILRRFKITPNTHYTNFLQFFLILIIFRMFPTFFILSFYFFNLFFIFRNLNPYSASLLSTSLFPDVIILCRSFAYSFVSNAFFKAIISSYPTSSSYLHSYHLHIHPSIF